MLPGPQRLRSGRDFRLVYARGRSYVHPMLILYVRPNGSAQSRIGFSISKKLGGAVVRNRIKRRLREACRARTRRLRPGVDVVLVGRSRLKDAPMTVIQSALDEMLARARLLQGLPAAERPSCGDSASG